MRENGKWHTRKFDGVPPFQVAARLAQAISHQPSFDDVIPKELVASLGELAGHTLRPGSARPQILVTPPQKEPWRIPENGWHVDLSASSSGRLPGIQVFVLLDDVAPHGGGTLALRGSHLSRGVTPDPERLVEMAGKAGDVYLMDMRTLHAPSINATRKARIMLTSRFVDAISIA
jgi:hypothetical protein